ncbi:MAG: hypothetical protein AB1634_05055 [Thermodesulfobacteriota bacterium]
MQQICEDLFQAFAISQKLGRPDYIGAIGQLLAEVFAAAGHKDEALAVLRKAGLAYAKIGNAGGLANVRQLQEAISKA